MLISSAEIVDYAMGGYMYFGGHADREPLMMNNNQPMLNAGAQAAIATLAAVWWARKTGQGTAGGHFDRRSHALRPRVDINLLDARGRDNAKDGARLHSVQGRLGMVLPVPMGANAVRAH